MGSQASLSEMLWEAVYIYQEVSGVDTGMRFDGKRQIAALQTNCENWWTILRAS
jgi:hypothetical protein